MSTATKASVSSWFGAQTFLGTRDSKVIANNTRVARRGDDFVVRLHETDVVTFHRGGMITLNTGGWYTMTTKDRLNSFIPHPFRVFSDKGKWYLGKSWEKTDATPFVDGLTFDPEKPLPKVDTTKQDRVNAKLERAIKAYVKGLTPEVLSKWITEHEDGSVSFDTTGDCLFCQFGDDDTGHFISHLEESYYMATLCLRALQERRYPQPGLILLLDARQPTPGYARTNHQSSTQSAVRRYLKKRLLQGAVNR